jgi:hypothetical protein
MSQRQMNPTRAPKMVVAISSPDPTMEAERTNPGPSLFAVFSHPVGGATIFSGVLS